MWIKGVRIDGFGRIVNTSFDFCDKFNCIYGPNEAGKTTLLSFLVSMLYGQAKPGLRNRVLDESHARYEPWSGAPYTGNVVLALSSGREIFVRRDFRGDADKIEITDASTGEPLLDGYQRNRRREYEIVEVHAGVDKRTFLSAFVVGHASLAGLPSDGKSHLADRLVALADTGDQKGGARLAVEALADLRGKIGTERAYTQPYALTASKIAKQRRLLEDVRKAREEYAAALTERADLKAKVDEARSQTAGGSSLVLYSTKAALDGIDAKIGSLEAEEKTIEPQLSRKAFRDLESDSLRDAERLLSEFADIRIRYREKEKRSSELSEPLARRKAQWEESSRTLQAISEEGRKFLASAGDLKADLLEKLAKAREGLGDAERIRARRNSCRAAMAFVVLATIGAAAFFHYLTESPLRTRGLLLSLLAGAVIEIVLLFPAKKFGRELARFKGQDAQAEEMEKRLEEHSLRVNDMCTMLGAESREEVMEALEEFDKEGAAIAEAEREIAALADEVETGEPMFKESAGKALSALAEIGITAGETLSGSIAAFLEGRESASPPAGMKAEDAFTDAIDASAVAAAFEALYAKVGQMSDTRKRLDEIRTELGNLSSGKEVLLGGRSQDEFLGELSQCEPLPEGTELLPEADIPTERRRIEKREQETSGLDVALAGVSARVDEGLKNYPEIAEVEETIFNLEERHERQVFYRNALDEAVATISAAAESFHKQIYPRIESNLAGLLSRVTLGAHDEVGLFQSENDPAAGLHVSVRDRLKGAAVAPESLSQGAVEQVYLCLRLALAGALSGDEPVPVMLDDPFINYDPQRLEAAIDVVAGAAGERQVFLFTCQEDVRDLAAGRGAVVIELGTSGSQ
ncbi:MAG: AAA family ATPase [Planctomycetes bacterium]|nr:AAA family ATPase [Planctomycetota bacterium]